MANLITYVDIKLYKPISINSNMEKKIDPFILEAQELDIMPIIGEELYNDLLAHVAQADYAKLLSGGSYTYNAKVYSFPGLKKVLAYYSYARYVLDANIEETATGFVHKTNNFSEQVSEKTILRKAEAARAAAYSYQEKMVEFLCRMSTSTYLSKWRSTPVETKRRGPRFSAVGK